MEDVEIGPHCGNSRESDLFQRLTAMKSRLFNPFREVLHDSVSATAKVSTRGRARSTRRRARIAVRMLAATIALALPLMQTAALANEQVLEIPQVVTTPTAHRAYHRHVLRHHVPDLDETTPAAAPDLNADATAADASAYANAGAPQPAPQPTAVAANTDSYPPDPNVGSIDDYQNQPGENGQPPSFSFGRGAPRSEPPASMATSLIVGGILVGMMALEIASAHHHHR